LLQEMQQAPSGVVLTPTMSVREARLLPPKPPQLQVQEQQHQQQPGAVTCAGKALDVALEQQQQQFKQPPLQLQQQQQRLSSLPVKTNSLHRRASGSQPGSPAAQQQQQQQQQPALLVMTHLQQPGSQLNSPVTQAQTPDSPFRNSPTSSSAFASIASVCWEQPTPAQSVEALALTDSTQLRLHSGGLDAAPSDAAAAAAAAVTTTAAAAAAAAAVAVSTGASNSNSSASGGTTSASQQHHQQQSQRLLQQRLSLQERTSAAALQRPEPPMGVPRQLSLPSQRTESAAAAAAAAGVNGHPGAGALLWTQSKSVHGGLQGSGEVLTGALPLEALPAVCFGKMNRHQSVLMQAMQDQVRRLLGA
jgi:hypothetical protein